MVDIIIYTLCGIGLGFLLGILAVAVLVDRRVKKRQRQIAQLIGRRGCGKSGSKYKEPYCYMDQEREEEWME